jgi:hypothetical protein
MSSRSRRYPVGLQPLDPRRRWKAITLATLLLVPAFWTLLAGLVSNASGEAADAPDPAASLAFGLAVIPFIFLVLAFLSQNPRVPMSVVKAMGLALVVGIPVTFLSGDVVTGIVAGAGSGGIVTLRSDAPRGTKARVLGVLAATVYTFVLVQTVGAIALLPAPILPFTAIGIADQVSDSRWQREKEARALQI